ncbi:VOC family protein [Flagellimonas onchidii]|uniref:VOC family protein n=1 Tax=Flagellimonas onchidii TaxID=2562684 RepID=UPI001F0E75F8|nr:VOC family protein [Allomuricauda onchidii]
MTSKNTLINYVEFKAHDLEETKTFYSQCFGWVFIDYGPTYTAFAESGLEGGFELSDENITKGALIVLYHHDLHQIQEIIVNAGGKLLGKSFLFLEDAGFILPTLLGMNWPFGRINNQKDVTTKS